jgi:hypothetical protein
MCVTLTPGGSVVGSTAKLWFCALTSILPAPTQKALNISVAPEQQQHSRVDREAALAG